MISEPIRAAVISDTHGLLRPEVERILQSCDLVIHAGDFDNQMVFHKLKIKQPLYAVRGNNDGDWAEQLPLIRRFKLGNLRFLLVHDQSDIPADAGDAQVVIFGHSHIHLLKQQNGQLWLNPGSCGYRRFTLPLSLVVLTLQEEGCQVETFFLREEGASMKIEKENDWVWIKGCTKKEETAEPLKKEERQEKPSIKKRLRERITEGQRQKDQLFVIAKIMRLMKRGEAVDWVAKNLRVEPVFVETVYRICVTHPQADAHQILDKMEVNRLILGRK